MGVRALACWLTAPLLGVSAVACITPENSAPPGEDAGNFEFDAQGAPDVRTADGGTFPDSAPDAPPVVDSGSAPDSPETSTTPPCAANNGGCDPNATCTNGATGAVCTCNAGFAGNGQTCTSDCLTKNGGCDPHATCSLGDAGVLCACTAGYAGSGVTCTSDCLTNNGGCDPNATCANGATGVVCSCNPGFSGTGATCFSDDYVSWLVPPDAPPETEYTVSADGTVVSDKVTGLVWQRQVFANPCPADVDAGAAGGCTWSDAQSYCGSLNALALGGISSGWRLPSTVELLSIVNYLDGTPSLDTAIFPATPAVSFWAKTPNASNAAQAWSVGFPNGLNVTQPTTTVFAVRCVTSVPEPSFTPTCGVAGDACCYANSCGPDLACNGSVCVIDANYAQSALPSDAPPESSSTVSPDGSIVTDGVTGLSWQREMFPSPCPGDGTGVCTQADASAYCGSLSSLAVGGVTSGWRLPSVAELLSIVNFAVPAPTLDTALFPGTPAVPFWTQTASPNSGGQAWRVDFSTGLNALQPTTVASAVRCVSSVAPSASPACGVASSACCYANACGPDLACNASTTCAVDGNYAQSILPADAPPELGYAVSTGGSTVTDAVTGLVWQRQLVANPCPSDAGAAGCTWAGAVAYCDALNTLTLGGYGAGWRLPTVTELISIANYAATPAIDPAPFSNPPAASFWSSTATASTPGAAWTMSYATGVNTPQPVASAFDVRCVNGSGATPAPEGCGALGQSCCYANSCAATLVCAAGSCATNNDYSLVAPPPDAPPVGQYTISSDTLTATDTATGLVWARFPGGYPNGGDPCGDGPGVCTWSHANAFCASLDGASLGGFSAGWRQPSIVDLLSIVNYSVASGPKIDGTIFVGATAAPYFSSTVAANGAAQAWTVDFSSGTNSLVSMTTALAPRCVH